jgi:WhiB family redox-sensing transcriptional regulator
MTIKHDPEDTETMTLGQYRATVPDEPAPLPPAEPARQVLQLVATPASWRDHANCLGVDADLFFPERGAHGQTADAKAVCAGCSVRAECLDYGMHERIGVWGGTSENDRKRIRRQRALARADARRAAAS